MKEYDAWNEKKKYIDISKTIRYCHAREIWWCKLGINIGDEEHGKGEEFLRPVLVLKCMSKNISLVAPITSSTSEHKYRIGIGNVENKNAKVVLSQIRIIDNKRFLKRIGILNTDYFTEIKNIFRKIIF